MSHRKRDSKRRWKKRCQLGRLIPGIVIVQYRLDKHFMFRHKGVNIDAAYAVRKTLRNIP